MTTTPPVDGMPAEVWSWLRDPIAVRPDVVAKVRALLDAGHRPTPDQVATAMIFGAYRGAS